MSGVAPFFIAAKSPCYNRLGGIHVRRFVGDLVPLWQTECQVSAEVGCSHRDVQGGSLAGVRSGFLAGGPQCSADSVCPTGRDISVGTGLLRLRRLQARTAAFFSFSKVGEGS